MKKKEKYFYNHQTLRYEKVEVSVWARVRQIFGILSATAVSVALISFLAFRFVGSPNEIRLRKLNTELEKKYNKMSETLADMKQQMKELETRDNDIYRTIFEAKPIPDSAREKKIEHSKEIQKVQQLENTDGLVNSIVETMNNLNNRISVQSKSYEELKKLLDRKQDLIAATPSIQPVSNKNLERIASGFGYRIDPVYKTVKKHEGLDFTAPRGTPIYATADGVVKTAGNTGNGFGNYVVIDHGFNYETLYGHMYKVKSQVGQKVKRGEVIGWVGNSGKSTGPHCHYEVHKNGIPVDPVYYFYNDLTPEQYDRVLKKAAAANQSMD